MSDLPQTTNRRDVARRSGLCTGLCGRAPREGFVTCQRCYDDAQWRSRLRYARNTLAAASGKHEIAIRKKRLRTLEKEHREYLIARSKSAALSGSAAPSDLSETPDTKPGIEA